MEICLFIICLNFAFVIISPMDLFGGHVGPAGAISTSFNDMNALTMDAVVAGLVLGGIVIAGWSFKSSAAVTAFGAIFGFSATWFSTILYQMLDSVSVPRVDSLVVIGVILGLYAFVGVNGAIQMSGTPEIIMA